MNLVKIAHHLGQILLSQPDVPIHILSQDATLQGGSIHTHSYCEMRFRLGNYDEWQSLEIVLPSICHHEIPLNWEHRFFALAVGREEQMLCGYSEQLEGYLRSPWRAQFWAELPTLVRSRDLRSQLARLLLTTVKEKEYPYTRPVIEMLKFDIDYEYYRLNYSIGALARQFGYSPKYIHELFQKDCGMTARQYLIQTRMKAACAYLSARKYSIKEIASLTGFRCQHYFCNVFRKFYGVPPSEYQSRKQ